MKLSLQNKITIVFGAISALTFLGIFIYLNNNLRQYTFERIRDRLSKETALTKTLLEQKAIAQTTSYVIDGFADKVGRDLGLRVTIINPAGVVLGDSELDGKDLEVVENHLDRPEVQEALNSGMGESRRFSDTIKKELLYVAMLFGKENARGVVRLSIPLAEITLISNRLKALLIVCLVFAFFLVMVVSFLSSVFISKPLREMSWVAKNIAKGNFSKRINVNSEDEIGDLAKSFNYMTEQIRARIEEVMISKSRMEAVLFSMFEGVMVVDLNSSIILINQTLKDLLHIKEEPIGKKPLEIVRNIEIQEVVDTALKLEKGVESREITILVQEERVILLHATPVIREGKPEGAVLVVHDITDLRRLEKIRQDFVANVSHELRTPVSNIKGYSETLLEGALNDTKNARDFVKIIHSDSDRLATLINDLLDLSKIESGKLKLNFKPHSLFSIVKRVCAGLRKQAEDNSIQIINNIPKDTPRILGDSSALAQVLLNIVDNAIKYNHPKGEINISAEDKGKFMQVDISDTGIGIPQEDLPRIFERFYRVDKARSRELGGTGLGLAIVKHIINAHNGNVWTESIAGQGSTFSFTVPKA